MFKALVKKSKGNKGFTLIELIVVIAIIAILALILVPRFAGFTSRAKDSADAATAKTIETAVQTLIANGEMTGNGSFDVDNGTDVSTPTSSLTCSGIETKLQELLGTSVKEQSGDAEGFTVTVTGSSIAVTKK